MLGWRPHQRRETDVSQMLTAGVGLEAVGGVLAFGCGGGAEAGVEDRDPPRVCTHTDTRWAGAGGQFRLSRCCPGRFSQPLGKGGEST